MADGRRLFRNCNFGQRGVLGWRPRTLRGMVAACLVAGCGRLAKPRDPGLPDRPPTGTQSPTIIVDGHTLSSSDTSARGALTAILTQPFGRVIRRRALGDHEAVIEWQHRRIGAIREVAYYAAVPPRNSSVAAPSCESDTLAGGLARIVLNPDSLVEYIAALPGTELVALPDSGAELVGRIASRDSDSRMVIRLEPRSTDCRHTREYVTLSGSITLPVYRDSTP